MGGGKLGPNRLNGISKSSTKAYLHDLGKPLTSFGAISGTAGGSASPVKAPAKTRTTARRKAVYKKTITYSSFSTSIGKIKQIDNSVELSNSSVSEESAFGHLAGNISKDVAQDMALHVLAVAFPPLGMILAGYAVAKVVYVGLETYKLIEDYKAGKATGKQVRKVAGDIAQTATSYMVDQALTYSPSGNGFTAEVASTVMSDATSDTTGVVAGNIAARSWRDHKSRDPEGTENGGRDNMVQSRLKSTPYSLELGETQENGVAPVDPNAPVAS